MTNKLVKDKTILSLIDRLKALMGVDAFDVVDRWDADLCAIGIARPDNHQLLVYVSVPTTRRQLRGFPRSPPPEPGSDDPYTPGDELQVQGFDKLVEIIERHFRAVD